MCIYIYIYMYIYIYIYIYAMKQEGRRGGEGLGRSCSGGLRSHDYY